MQEPEQSTTEKELEEKSKIYTKNQPLTNYQNAINKASAELAKQDYSLLLNRGKLVEESRKKVKAEGYKFVKGKSRAKGCEDQPTKRVKTTKDDRAEYIKLLNQDISTKKEQIRYKEQRVGMAKNSKNWELCDKLTGEISKLRKETFELEQEFKLMQRKQSQSLWYEKSKSKKKVEGKKNDKMIHLDGSDEVITIDAKDSGSSSATIPNLFSRLKEQKSADVQSVPEIVVVEEAGANFIEECTTKSPLSEFVPGEVTGARETEDVHLSECGQNEEDTNVHFL